ncbi:transient receptor potential cation channel subfamily A member 1-like isoform X2 [Mizuhopecten yessoensis]|uniref:transient receptor potential cation channel subfamily A member 1-like isoform X2 n=1 Tax=Mizuhopecten yessoensis TaxID=6573 RepID=UPI000B45F329|nr:transient receptor potential cation channel subfamily A member 1-like isoform X2 [Mizuhopecten yessoensis]
MVNFRKRIFPGYVDAMIEDDSIYQQHEERPDDEVYEFAAKGNLSEVQRLYEVDRKRIFIQDCRGWAALHHAAANGHLNVVDFIVTSGAEINLQNKNGDTALHLAVEGEHADVIGYLLKQSAKTTLLNEVFMAPIHLAVDGGKIKALESLLKFSTADVILKGEGGFTPLHYCASKDRDECAKLLLQYGARPCMTCSHGFYPIHVAAKSAAAKTLEVLIKHVENLGYTREQVLSFTDKANNMPLHAAVNGGDIEAVRVCIAAGAAVDAQQEDKSTPLHFACAQGSVELIKIMQELQPTRFSRALTSNDVLKMTPLHRAALFNHVNVVEYLLKQGAEIDAQDSQDRTPLLIAASKGCWKTVQCLIENNVSLAKTDRENRNFLHLAIKFGGRLNEFGVELLKDVKTLLNEKDDFGCTPLHYASREGHLVAIDDLINLGAHINPKNNDKQSPLHFAARYGRYNTCRRLLDSPQGANIINETDGEGLSALNLGSLNGHTKIIHLLMEKGAYVTRDHDGNSPLHMAASNGYTKTIKILLSVHANLLDATNKYGETALHVASKEGKTSSVDLLLTLGAKMTTNKEKKSFFDTAIEAQDSDVALTIVRHERWREAMSICSGESGGALSCPMYGLIQYLPDVCMVVLDRCLTQSNEDERKSGFYIEYDFSYLQAPIEYVKKMRTDDKEVSPLFSLNAMVKFGRVQCLSHSLCKAFLSMKWRAYGLWFHSTNLVLYLIYLGLLTTLVTTTTLWYPSNDNDQNSTNESSTDYNSHKIEIHMAQNMCVYIVVVFTSLNIFKEIAQMYQQRMKYFTDLGNALEWVLYITTAVFVVPMVTGVTYKFQVEAGAIAIFLAWFNCLLFLQRFDVFGIYVVMFLEILSTLIQALSVFSLLIVAFGFAFFLLMKSEATHAYTSPGMAILRSGMMMLELDYMASFNDPLTDGDKTTLGFGGLTIFFLIMFVILMPILLINLLIGLAVGDIESVQSNATLKRLAMQVELHTDLERRLPKWLLLKVDKVQYRYFPNRCGQGMKSLWSKMTWNKSNGLGSDDSRRHDAYLYTELHKQKQRMKDMGAKLEKQYDLLRLIVQKMDIATEEDNKDEGVACATSLEKIHGASFAAPFIKKTLLRQNAIVSHWKKTSDKVAEKSKNEHDC